MTEPDIRPVGWVTDQPGATVLRARSPVLLVAAVALIVGGLAVGTLGIVRLVVDGGPDGDAVVAEGVVAGLDGPSASSARFTAGGDDPFTVWLQTDGLQNSETREAVVAATECTAALPGDGEASFRGSRQANSVSVGDQSTVGWFTAAEGEVEVTCRQVEFGSRRGRDRLRDERDFVVASGKPSFPYRGMVLLAIGIVAFIIGLVLVPRWHQGRLRRR